MRTVAPFSPKAERRQIDPRDFGLEVPGVAQDDRVPPAVAGCERFPNLASRAHYTHDVIREARLGDFGAVMGLYGQLHPDDSALEDGTNRTVFDQILGSDDFHLFVLDIDGVVLATTYLNVVPNLTRSASPYAVIENVVVDEAHRGRGLGKKILERALRTAWEAGCYKAMLMTGSHNPAVHSFYRASGFSSDAKTAYLARPL
jgi:GNAT superfamily N-acetyltransferase